MTRAAAAPRGADDVDEPAEGPGELEGPIRVKILVVDDDSRNLLAVKEILDAPGVEVVLASDGEEALREVLRDDFAVILLDVQMPGLDGYEVASMIRSRPRSSRIPIIFLTAFNKDDVHVFRGYSAGAVDFVFKPIEPIVLTSKVGIFVDLHRKTEEIRQKAEAERRLLMENLRVRGEKLRAEENLRRQEERQSIVLRSLPIALYTSPIQGGRALAFAGDAVGRITGYSAQDFADPDFWESQVDASDLARAREGLAALHTTGGATLDYRFRAKDGSERYILDQVALTHDDSGSPREIFGMWLDVTERKMLEESLVHASKLEAIGRLTGGIAHDFNNMLSVVIGNLDLAQNRLEDTERVRKRLQMAIEGAQRCAELTHRLLAFSRREPMQTSVVDLRTVVPEMAELVRRTLDERIEVVIEIPEQLPPVDVDITQLESALVNLSVNARDAMPDGGRLTLSLRERSPDLPGQASRVSITVWDTGIGMGPEIRDRVFEPFFTTKESGKGTGLGLSMVYGFVRQSKGEISIESAPGEGTSIEILLPAAEGVANGRSRSRAVRARSQEDAGPAELTARGETILLVEDDPRVRQVTAAALRSLGFTVREAENGEAAIKSLATDGKVDLLFSDVRMPGGLSGTDLARRVRTDWPSIKVLLTSGYVDEGDEIGPFDIIYKPYRTADLAGKVQSVLRQERTANEPA